MARLFFALWPDDLVRKQIANVIAKLPPKGNKVKPANLHATLAFMGNSTPDQVNCYIKAADQISSHPFDLQLDSREWWKKSQVTCLGASSLPDPLFDLVSSLNNSLEPCGYNPEQRPFRLHITLMRKVKHPITPVEFRPIPWLVRGFSLVESETLPSGAEYRVIQSWDFVG